MSPLLSIKNLRVSFKNFTAVNGVSFDVEKNEVFAVVGESGSGKSAAALSITRLHNKNFTRVTGEILFGGKNLLTISERELYKIRGKEIAVILQDPTTALNPLIRAGKQIEEPLLYHTNFSAAARKSRVLELLNAVGIANPHRVYSAFPHELSGGMCQRIVIAAALACEPALIIADEPTTALDVTVQSQILDLLGTLQKNFGTAIILITHDLGVVAETAHRVAVMHEGQIVETADVRRLFKNPSHPYTRRLLDSMP
ncbi:MAG: ABC transporter ATP-binding protein [Defluviitaleaceae bacterium]|nr:ABC transporter ATP-binding protein [Defluviitaleaceae bacterium]